MEISDLHLQKMRYPNNDFDCYFITAQTVAEVLAVGKIPHITLPQRLSGPTVAILMAVEKHPDREEPDYYVPEFYVEAITQNGGNPVFIGFDKLAHRMCHLFHIIVHFLQTLSNNISHCEEIL